VVVSAQRRARQLSTLPALREGLALDNVLRWLEAA
jgi:hypothetical protein